FCNTPFVRDVQTEAVQCPQCGTYSDIRVTNCTRCKAWVVVKCIFCGALSPHHYPACVSCHEYFACAAERGQARPQQAPAARRAQMISSVGGVAAAFLGAAAGVALTEGGEYIAGKHEHRHSDESGSWTDFFSGDGSGGNLTDTSVDPGGG